MNLDERIRAFVELGNFLGQFSREKIEKKAAIAYNDLFFDAFKLQIKRAQEINGWFTEDNVLFAFEQWTKLLVEAELNAWTSAYRFDTGSTKTIAIIMAGNIPMVGFHDLLSTMISGHRVLVKQSSNDNLFLPLMVKYLEYVQPEFKGQVQFTEEKLEGFDAAIATGSNNTSRYFDHYFGKYPHIIRRNRNSVAILSGNESDIELKALGEDIFRYFGLGCRSVSKLFVPKNYNFDRFFGAIYDYHPVINYKKYQNNYDYNKAVYLMSNFELLENGFLMLKEDSNYASPIATLFYEYYDTTENLRNRLLLDTDLIQCVVGKNLPGAVPFGETQQPRLNDYADGVDTLAFLSHL
ncbi:MAG: acyl-CoA reductase [Flavobacteriaceae bacterium]|nr:acyl-CoA reductase [Flavobacteriaceae bacterium]